MVFLIKKTNKKLLVYEPCPVTFRTVNATLKWLTPLPTVEDIPLVEIMYYADLWSCVKVEVAVLGFRP